MTIRPLTTADLPLIRMWMRDTPEAPTWSDDDLARLVAPQESDDRRMRRSWMAMNGDTPAGFIAATALCVIGVPAECDIEFVMSAPSCRRGGVAGALVDTVLDWARELAAEQVRLEVRASNKAAQRLYERCGFEIAGRRPGYYAAPTEDAVLMRRGTDSGGQGRLV